MKYYKGRRESHKGLVTKILIVSLVCLLTFLITVFIGNRLKAKIDDLDSAHGEGGEVTLDQSGSNTDFSGGEKNDTPPEKLSVFAASVTAEEIASLTEDEIAVLLQSLKDSDYGGISVALTREDGVLLYASDAALDFYRIDYPETYPACGKIKHFLSVASSLGLRSIAVYAASDIYSDDEALSGFHLAFDSALAEEISSLGFDEIALLGCVGTAGINSDTAVTILKYVGALRQATHSKIDFSLSVNYRYYLDSNCAQQIELIAQYVEVMTIDLRGHQNPAALCDSLSGSFSLYSLRAVTDSLEIANLVRPYVAGSIQIITGTAG